MLQDTSCCKGGVQIYGTPWLPLTPSRQRQPVGHPRRQIGFSREDPARADLLGQIPAGTHTAPDERRHHCDD